LQKCTDGELGGIEFVRRDRLAFELDTTRQVTPGANLIDQRDAGTLTGL
jgi:hypothetical protein